ncbi:peptidase M23 [Actinoplanes sp. NPDC000266]
MRPLFVIAVAVLAGFIISPLLRANAACTPSPAASASTVTLTKWNDEQVANARLIVTIGNERRVPNRGLVIAVATALQESGLRNLRGGDRDSIGLFQQRPSQGWGTPKQLSDPGYQTRKFYDKLLTINGWQTMRLTDAAQAVQISAFPNAYAKHTTSATHLVEALSAPAPCTSDV